MEVERRCTLDSKQTAGADCFQEMHRTIIAGDENVLAIIDRIARDTVFERVGTTAERRLLLENRHTNATRAKRNTRSKTTESAADNDNMFGHTSSQSEERQALVLEARILQLVAKPIPEGNEDLEESWKRNAVLKDIVI